MNYSSSNQQAPNFNPEMYANQIFNSTSRPIRRPMYLPGPMAKGNFIGGLQMLGDAYGGLKNTLSNRNLKKRLFEESLPEYYKYTVEKDPNDPNDYVLDTKDLYDAMMGEGRLRTPDVYESDLKKYSMVDFDPESGQYNTMYSSRPIDQDLYPGYSDIFGEGSKSLGQIREDIMNNQELMDLITQAEGAPEGFFPYMEPDGRMGVTEDPEYMQYYYNTMMGNYEMGGSLPEAQVGMSLFDPNALDAGIGVTGGGAGIRSNSNSSNITAETLATDVTREGGIFSKAAENLVDFFKTLEMPRLYSPFYEHGGLVEYQNYGQVDRPTFQEWFIENQVTASAMNQEEAEQAYDLETLDPVDYMMKYDTPEITEPDITIPDDVTISNPTVTGEKAKFQRFLDSPGMDLFGGIGTFGVQGAGALNEMFGLDRVAREAEEDRMRMTSADNAFMASNPLFDQGVYDVNTGLTPGGYAKGFGMARLGMEVDADPEIIEALVKAGANINYI